MLRPAVSRYFGSFQKDSWSENNYFDEFIILIIENKTNLKESAKNDFSRGHHIKKINLMHEFLLKAFTNIHCTFSSIL